MGMLKRFLMWLANLFRRELSEDELFAHEVAESLMANPEDWRWGQSIHGRWWASSPLDLSPGFRINREGTIDNLRLNERAQKILRAAFRDAKRMRDKHQERETRKQILACSRKNLSDAAQAAAFAAEVVETDNSDVRPRPQFMPAPRPGPNPSPKDPPPPPSMPW